MFSLHALMYVLIAILVLFVGIALQTAQVSSGACTGLGIAMPLAGPARSL